jgi:hypothetical protein
VRLSLGRASPPAARRRSPPPLAQVAFAVCRPCRVEFGGQAVEVLAGQAGQGGMRQRCPVPPALLLSWAWWGARLPWRGGCLRAQGAVPVAVPVMPGDRKGAHLLVADLDAGRVAPGAEFGVDLQRCGWWWRRWFAQ